MTQHITLIRAIGSEFITRKFKPVLILTGGVTLLALVVAIYMTTLNAWWWVLTIPVIAVVFIELLVWAVIRVAVNRLRPKLSSLQSRDISGFVDKLERVTENTQMPMPFIVFQILQDVLFKRDKTFIQKIAQDSTTLHKDYIRLLRSSDVR